MARVTLASIVPRQKDAQALLAAMQGSLETPLNVTDVDGRVLYGSAPSSDAVRHLVSYDDKPLGYVEAAGYGRVIADVLEHLLGKECERKALGSEVLHLYREVNLIYNFSEKLASLLDVDGVARLTLQEARHLIVATDGVVMLMDEPSGALSAVASFGDVFGSVGAFQRGVGILGRIVETGIAEVVDDIEADPGRAIDGTGLRSLICAPLKVGDRVSGVIALASSERLGYTAADLKLLNTLGLQTGTAMENARLFERTVEAGRERERLMQLHEAAEVARAKLDSEMALAARIQADLFPSELPVLAGYELAATNRPALRCGGDYYDAIRVKGSDGRDQVLLCVADVSGKGMPASLLMSSMQATLRALLGRLESLPEVAGESSRLLFATTSASRYVTAALLKLDPESGQAVFVGAGHLDNFVLTGDQRITRLSSTGMPLGLIAVELPFEETAITVAPGDCVVLYSDGVTDAQNVASEEFGDDRLHEVIRATAHEPAQAIIEQVVRAIDQFAGEAPQFDDITMMVLKRLPLASS